MTSDSNQHLVGQQIGAYRVTGVLGRGGMGIVLRARQETLNRDVALKLMLVLDEPEARARFLQEAQTVARLNHPGVLGVLDAGEHQGRVWFAMALAEGATLKEVLPQTSPQRTAELLGQVAEALDYVHSKGLIHRDIKPSNVMLDLNGRPQLMDFGLVKDTSKAGMTMEGSTLGTPAFMSPEQAGGELSQVDHRTDIYALGAILYTALAGRPPYAGASTINIITAILKGPPPRPSKVAADVPPELERICLRAMAPDKEDRYPRAGDMASELLAFARGEGPARKSSPLPLAGLAALLLIGGASALVVMSNRPADERPSAVEPPPPVDEPPVSADPQQEDPAIEVPPQDPPGEPAPTADDPPAPAHDEGLCQRFQQLFAQRDYTGAVEQAQGLSEPARSYARAMLTQAKGTSARAQFDAILAEHPGYDPVTCGVVSAKGPALNMRVNAAASRYLPDGRAWLSYGFQEEAELDDWHWWPPEHWGRGMKGRTFLRREAWGTARLRIPFRRVHGVRANLRFQRSFLRKRSNSPGSFALFPHVHTFPFSTIAVGSKGARARESRLGKPLRLMRYTHLKEHESLAQLSPTWGAGPDGKLILEVELGETWFRATSGELTARADRPAGPDAASGSVALFAHAGTALANLIVIGDLDGDRPLRDLRFEDRVDPSTLRQVPPAELVQRLELTSDPPSRSVNRQGPTMDLQVRGQAFWGRNANNRPALARLAPTEGPFELVVRVEGEDLGQLGMQAGIGVVQADPPLDQEGLPPDAAFARAGSETLSMGLGSKSFPQSLGDLGVRGPREVRLRRAGEHYWFDLRPPGGEWRSPTPGPVTLPGKQVSAVFFLGQWHYRKRRGGPQFKVSARTLEAKITVLSYKAKD